MSTWWTLLTGETSSLGVEGVVARRSGSGVSLSFTVSNRSESKVFDFLKLYVGDAYIGLKHLSLEGGRRERVSFDLEKELVRQGGEVVLTTDDRSHGAVFRQDLEEILEEIDDGSQPVHEPEDEQEEEGISDQRWKKLQQEYEDLQDEVEERHEELSELREEHEAVHEEEQSTASEEDMLDQDEQDRPQQGGTDEESREGTPPGDVGRTSDEEDTADTVEEIQEPDEAPGQTGEAEEVLQDKLEQVKDQQEKEEHERLVESVIHSIFGEHEEKKPRVEEDEDPREREPKAREEENEPETGVSMEEMPSEQVARVSTGIIGLDEKMQDGFVEGTMNLVTGKTGVGKTAFCASFLKEGAESGEPGVYVTTEEREEDIRADIQAMFGWEFGDLEEQDLVKILSIKPIFPSKEIDNLNRLVRSYISNLLDQVTQAVEEIDADRVIIDSVSIIEMFIRDEYMARVALASLLNKLREADVTALLTGTVPETSEGLSGGGIIEFLVDTVILLEFVPVAEEHKRTLTIRKMRRTDHDVEIFPFEITPEGIVIHEVM